LLPAANLAGLLTGAFLPAFSVDFLPAPVFSAFFPAEATEVDRFFFFFPGGVVGVVGFEVAGASSGMSLLAMGEPNPVHASHPEAAENAPLFPSVTSLNADAALAA
jgi:hypothetical protein